MIVVAEKDESREQCNVTVIVLEIITWAPTVFSIYLLIINGQTQALLFLHPPIQLTRKNGHQQELASPEFAAA